MFLMLKIFIVNMLRFIVWNLEILSHKLVLSIVSQFKCCYLPEVNFEKSAIVCGEFFCIIVLIPKTCGSPSGL